MAADMFLDLKGVDGESQDDTYKNKIEVLSWSWGAHNQSSMWTGGGGGASKVDFQAITITKVIDRSSPTLLKFVTVGEHVSEGILICRKSGGKKPVEYIKIELKDVKIDSWNLSGHDGSGLPTESITLSFAEFKYTYTEQDAKGAGAKQPEFGWKIKKNA